MPTNKAPMLSPWHPHTTPPEHDGVYEVNSPYVYEGTSRYSYFYKGVWYWQALTIESAISNANKGYTSISSPILPWRGIVC